MFACDVKKGIDSGNSLHKPEKAKNKYLSMLDSFDFEVVTNKMEFCSRKTQMRFLGPTVFVPENYEGIQSSCLM